MKKITIDNIIQVRNILESQPDPDHYLAVSREHLESKMFIDQGFDFSKDELDKSENSQCGFIGIRKGFKCYLIK